MFWFRRAFDFGLTGAPCRGAGVSASYLPISAEQALSVALLARFHKLGYCRVVLHSGDSTNIACKVGVTMEPVL